MKEFISEVDISIYNLSSFPGYEFYNQRVEIKWGLSIEYRYSGIESIIPSVDDQSIELNYEVWSEEEGDYIEGSVRIDLKDVSVIIEKPDISLDYLQLYPSELSINSDGSSELIFTI